VHQRVVEVDEERRFVGDAGADERRGAFEVVGVAVAAHVEGELVAFGDVGVASAALHHPRHRVPLWVVPRVGRPQRFVVGARRPVPLIEALVGRPPPWSFADVPLAVGGARVAGRRQEVTEGLLPGDQAPAMQRAERDAVVAGADRVAPRQQRRPARCALRFRGVVRQTDPLAGERVDATCPGAAERTAAVAAQLPETEVVDVEEEDVRPAGHPASVAAGRRPDKAPDR
jgi:hypothetical protein